MAGSTAISISCIRLTFLGAILSRVGPNTWKRFGGGRRLVIACTLEVDLDTTFNDTCALRSVVGRNLSSFHFDYI